MGGPGLAPGDSLLGGEEEEWVPKPYQPPSADEVALVARDARVLAYEVWNFLLADLYAVMCRLCKAFFSVCL